MDYTIEPGIKESELAAWLDNAANRWGTFEDKRVNYKNADVAPIVMCTLLCNNELLLVKRGYGLADAEGYWSTVNGFIDEFKPVYEQVIQEVREELGITIDETMITVRDSYTLKNPKEKRSYIVFPCLVTLQSKPDIFLDTENTEFAWILRSSLRNYHVLNDLSYAIDAALGL